MTNGTVDIIQGRSHAFIRYVQRFGEVTRELRLLKIGLALTLAVCLLMLVFLGKMSDEHAAKSGSAERIALIFAITFFILYKWREQWHSETLREIETGLPPEERSAIGLVKPTEG